MFWTIVITLVVSWLLIGVVFCYNKLQNSRGEIARLRRENGDMSRRIRMHDSDVYEQRVKSAYNRGLYDGRKTDELYRQILNRYQNGDQVTVMMHGEDRDRGDGE